MPVIPASAIAVRSYGAESTVDSHAHAQIVLPLSGRLAMDIAGRESLLDRHVSAYVPAGARHDQVSSQANRSLIVDLHPDDLDARSHDLLGRRTYSALSPDADHLVDYMAVLTDRGRVPEHRLRLWIALLVDALLGDDPGPRSRLAGLLASVEGNLGKDWTVATMAARVGLSSSRLHALFLHELRQTPHAWLSSLRLQRVQQLLVDTDLPIAELAYRCGYADQSALTRALRKATGLTPAVCRRQARVQA